MFLVFFGINHEVDMIKDISYKLWKQEDQVQLRL